MHTHSTPVAMRHQGSVTMKSEVELARSIYVRNMQVRFGLIDSSGTDLVVIRKTVLLGAMLNPIYGMFSCYHFHIDLLVGMLLIVRELFI